jgi:hypothetical protein
MAHLNDRATARRAERALLLTTVGGGLVACAIGALIYDLTFWLGLH